jgi:hypothetical protein
VGCICCISYAGLSAKDVEQLVCDSWKAAEPSEKAMWQTKASCADTCEAEPQTVVSGVYLRWLQIFRFKSMPAPIAPTTQSHAHELPLFQEQSALVTGASSRRSQLGAKASALRVESMTLDLMTKPQI